MKWINKAFEQSAYEWDISYNVAWLLFWMPVLFSVLVVFSALNRNLFRFMLAEDGPIEWATFGLFVAAMILGVLVTNLCLRANLKWHAWFFGFFTIAMLFCAGEELSWGQRLFDWETPDALRIPGVQDEIIFHNLGGTFGIFNIGILLVEFIGGIAYFVKRQLTAGKPGNRLHYFFPPLCLASSFAIALIYRLLQITIWQEREYVVQKYVEWTELCLAFGLVVFAWLVLRQLRMHIINRQYYAESRILPLSNRRSPENG